MQMKFSNWKLFSVHLAALHFFFFLEGSTDVLGF